MRGFKLNDYGQSAYVMTEAPSLLAIAGFGSGKTHGDVAKLFSWMHKWPDISHGYFAPTYGLIRDIFVPQVEQFCAENKIACKFQKNENKMYVQGYEPIYCRSMNEPDTIVGFEIGNAILDEIDILTKDKAWKAWRKIKGRCRRKMYKPGEKKKKKNEVPNQMAVSTTPEGFKFAHDAFEKNPIEGSQIIRLTTYDNRKNLPVGYIEELMANYPANMVDAYILGKFTNLLSGTVYSSFDRHLNDAPGILPLKRETIHVGMDFNIGKMAGIIHVIRNGRPIACGEIINKIDTPDMIFALKNLYPTNKIVVYPDASGQSGDTRSASKSDIKLLQDAGFMVRVDASNPAVKDRIIAMNAMLFNAYGQRRYLVNVEACPFYTECLEQQAYDDNGLPDKKSGHDHPNDAGGYFITKMFSLVKPNSQAKKAIL